MRSSLLGCAALVCGVALGRDLAAAAVLQRARVLMGTLCTATATTDDAARAESTLSSALDEIARLEDVMSSWRAGSELSRLNRSGGARPFACSPDLAAVLDSALSIARLTDGAFDPTVEPLMTAWDLRGEGRVPDAATLARARSSVGWPGLSLDRATRTARFARTGMGVDLGGIGKGFALDRAAEGVAGTGPVLINLGGEVVVRGGVQTIAVAHPRRRLTPVVEIPVDEKAVSTSGQSERGFTANGRRFGHVLDPRTGVPVPTDATVTVLCGSATRADGLSTALLVMGRERAAAFVLVHPEVGVLWLEPEGDRVRAWRWNLSGARAARGAAVRWMNEEAHTTLMTTRGTRR
jgi:FAD:protein FMN transferase